MSKHCEGKNNIKVILLAGSLDFGRCPIACRLPTALWPAAGRPILENLINSSNRQGIKYITICSDCDDSLLRQSIHVDRHLELKFLDEELPVGAAGCIRNAIVNEIDTSDSDKTELFLVFSANIVSLPKIDDLISTHRQSKSDLTVMFNPSNRNSQLMGEPADVYVCNPEILEHVPQDGYFDIKEGLIPEMLRAGKTVHAAVLSKHVGNFRDRQGYLRAIANYIENASELNRDLRLHKQSDSQTVWMAANVNVDPSARVYGPVVVLDGACIEKDAVIFGPTIVGRNVTVGKDSLVVNSVVWDNAQIGLNCEIQRSIVDYNVTVPGNTIVKEQTIAFKPNGVLTSLVGATREVAKNNVRKLQHAMQPRLEKINYKLPNWVQLHKTKVVPWFGASLVCIAFLWSYWFNIKHLWNLWQQSDEYSSGFLVPFLAIYILWSRRNDIADYPVKPCLWGLFAFVAAQTVRLFGLFFMYGSVERISIALSIAALVLLLFGWQLFRKISTVLLFLCLMLPWPNRIQAAVTLPMQRWATSSAVFCLEILGYEVLREGNIIHIGSATVAVAEACNGLRMVTAFFVISGLVVLLVNRTWWEKLIILASSLPIALLCNTTRLTITAFAFTILKGEYWEKMFHDFGGYAMMPLALAIVVAELWLLTKLTTPPLEEQTIIVARQNG